MKRIISLLLVFVLLFSVNYQVFAEEGYNSKEYKVSQIDKINYVKMNIEDSSLNFVIQNIFNKNDCFVKINDIKKLCELRKDNKFYLSFSLNDLSEGNYNISIYFGNKGDEFYWTFLKREIIIINNNGNWFFKKEDFYDNNKKVSDLKDKSCYDLIPVSDFVKEFSNNIVGNAKTDEEKVERIHKWIVENIAYDYDAYWKKLNSYSSPDFVLKEKRAVCYGISLTFQALCSAQNIPSIVYTGYSYNEENVLMSHAWNEVFINNQWFVFDATLNVHYGFKNGKRERLNNNEGIYYHSFMDMNGASVDLKYEKQDELQKEIKKYFSEFKNSQWSTGDILNSIYFNIYNGEQEGDFSRPITRAEFCELLYYYICRQFYDDGTFDYSKEDLEYILWDGKPKYFYPFLDDAGDYKPFIYCCYKFGIVKGKTEIYFGPNDYITRQEAATMIFRTIDFFNKQNSNFKRSYNTKIRFNDDKYIGDWARDSISIVNDMGIMNGIENNNFDPLSTYTVEQSIATLCRLFQYNYRR